VFLRGGSSLSYFSNLRNAFIETQKKGNNASGSLR
jgi:hypothetical protein